MNEKEKNKDELLDLNVDELTIDNTLESGESLVLVDVIDNPENEVDSGIVLHDSEWSDDAQEKVSLNSKNFFMHMGTSTKDFFLHSGVATKDFCAAIPSKTKDKTVGYIDKKKTAFEDFKTFDSKKKKSVITEWLINNALYILIVLFIIIVEIYNYKFLSFGSIVNITTQSAARLSMALGIAGIIVLTGTDLSAGRAMGLCACIIASLLQRNDIAAKMFPGLQYSAWLIPLALVIAIIVGALIGAFNGFFVAKFQLHPFIVTLGTQLILYGVVQLFIMLGNNAGAPIASLDDSYKNLITGGFSIGDVMIPNLIWFAVAVTFIMWFVWNKTKIGKNMFAVGCNPEAAKVSGISVFMTILIVFTIAGALYGVTAFIEAARIGSNTTSTGVNYELDAIAACVIGGVSFMGGIGKIKGVVIGVVLLQLVNAGLLFLELSAAFQTIVKGLIILAASAIDMRKYIAKK